MFITLGPSDTAFMEGTETGKLTVRYCDAQTLVLHELGHHYHSGIGRAFHYAPARFYVYHIIERQRDRLRVERIATFEAQYHPDPRVAMA